MSIMDNKSSSSSGEKVTIAYTETLECSEDECSEDTSSFTTTSYSLDTPTSQLSVSTVLGALETFKETEEFFGYLPVPTDAGPKMNAFQYFWVHSIFQLYSFMMTHLLANTPEDPVEFLITLVNRCIDYRDGKDEQPPLVFEDNHIASVYTALDPLDDGSITYKQYVNGMMTLGLSEFNVMPNEICGRLRDVPKKVFLQEAKKALVAQLDRWLGSPTKSTLNSEESMFIANSSKGDKIQRISGQFDVKENEFSVVEETVAKEKHHVSIKSTPTGSRVVTASFELTPDAPDDDKLLSFIKTPITSQNKSSDSVFSKSASNASLKL